MQEPEAQNSTGWDDKASQLFIDYGRYFVPEREMQTETICGMIDVPAEPCHIVELCCGDGVLAEALLERFPQATVHGFDGSSIMLARATERLGRFGERFETQLFDLASSVWRRLPWPVYAVVSSLAIHHLDGPQKQELFRDVLRLLAPGGRFLIADVVQAVDTLGVDVAGRAWDAAVERRALAIDGTTAALEFFQREHWNMYRYPDPPETSIDKPSSLYEQVRWLDEAGFQAVDVYWMQAGHAIFGGRRGDA